MITLNALILALHDGAKAAERSTCTLATVLHAITDSLAESAQEDPSFRSDQLVKIIARGSRDA